ncbi:MAG: response regulator transcription factor, partial [Anaerolineales bacterium]|nr:response regulator transcription factor [Anaerolineales bacterium]
DADTNARVELPCVRPEARMSVPANKILIVFDEPMIAQLYDLILRNQGFETVVADLAAEPDIEWWLNDIDLVVFEKNMYFPKHALTSDHLFSRAKGSISSIVLVNKADDPTPFDSGLQHRGLRKPVAPDRLKAVVQDIFANA